MIGLTVEEAVQGNKQRSQTQAVKQKTGFQSITKETCCVGPAVLGFRLPRSSFLRPSRLDLFFRLF
jgi:hypothetical protein